MNARATRSTGNGDRPRRVIVLGSTGSIGTSTLCVAENLGDHFEVVGLSAGRGVEPLIEQAHRFGVRHVAIADADAAGLLARSLPDTAIFAGPDASRELIEAVDADLCVAAIVGAAGLPATLDAIRKGMDIALANKETLVAAGELVMPLVREHGVNLLPVDSEHSAIFQCLQECGGATQRRSEDAYRGVKRIVLTASGGPFRSKTAEQIAHATVEEALNHPTWNMGPKITIDSATMMNKTLEIIEAHWLFGLRADQIEVIVHPQSIVHSFVEFVDNSVLAQLGPPDMRTPIQYALTWPDRAPCCSRAMDFAALSTLVFEPADFDRFPALSLAYRVIELGGTAGAILNAANEAAVAAFLERRIGFGRIVDLAAQALDAIDIVPARDLATILDADRAARAFVDDTIAQTTR